MESLVESVLEVEEEGDEVFSALYSAPHTDTRAYRDRPNTLGTPGVATTLRF